MNQALEHNRLEIFFEFFFEYNLELVENFDKAFLVDILTQSLLDLKEVSSKKNFRHF